MIQNNCSDIYHHLTSEEANTLEKQGCIADDWRMVEITEEFSTEFIRNVRFQGMVRLGNCNGICTHNRNTSLHSGIYNCTIRNCVIGNNCYISNIGACIANTIVQDNCYIENVNRIDSTGDTRYGNGTMIDVVNESGGRAIPITISMNAQTAYLMALYRHDSELISKMIKMTETEAQSLRGCLSIIGGGSRITDCGSLIDIYIAGCATINGATHLSNGTILSNQENQTYIGNGVIARDFIIQTGAYITDNVIVERSLIGEAVSLKKQFSVSDSAIFCNCDFMHGEAYALLAGPFCVSHHKSSQIATGTYSFVNIGSGSNQSNHLYKLGPIQQGMMERGCKTASDSYVLWPAKFGPHSTIIGRHYAHPDTSDFPFSYVIGEGNRTILIPGIALRSSGVWRDAMKWPKRDKRVKPYLDSITFDLLNPYTMRKVSKAIDILTHAASLPSDGDFILYGNCHIRKESISRAIEIYQLVLNIYARETNSEWRDILGAVIPVQHLNIIIEGIKKGRFETLNDIANELAAATCDSRNMPYAPDGSDRETIQKWYDSSIKLYDMILEDAGKEFDNNAMVSYGCDATDTVINDFKAVKGTFDTNSFITDITRIKDECERILNERN